MYIRVHPKAIPITVYNWRRTHGQWVRFKPAHGYLGGIAKENQELVAKFLEHHSINSSESNCSS